MILKAKFAFRVFPVEQGPWEVRVTQKLRSITMLCGKGHFVFNDKQVWSKQLLWFLPSNHVTQTCLHKQNRLISVDYLTLVFSQLFLF